MQFTVLINVFLLFATTIAAPTLLDSTNTTPAAFNNDISLTFFQTLVPAPNAQNCLAEKHGVGSTTRTCYTITIGAIYDNGGGCDGIKDRIDEATGRLNHKTWECTGESADENPDYTRLYFCLLGSKDVSEMNEALAAYYPMINGFNCPKD